MEILRGLGRPSAGPGAPRSRSWASRTKATWAVLVVGLCLAVFAGLEWQGESQARQRQSFDVIANDAAARVAATLRQNLDLIDTARAVVEANPDVNNQQFVQFMTTLDASTQYEDSIVVVYIQRVRASQLDEFWATDGSPVQGTVGSQLVSPPGSRPQYCLLRAGALQVLGLGIFSAGAAIPAGTDYCAAPAAMHFLQTAADTGQFVVTTLQAGLSMTEASLHLPTLSSLPVPAQHAITALFRSSVVIAPVYGPGSPTATTAERQAALMGWSLDVIDTKSILANGVDSPRLSATLLHQNPRAKLTTIVRTGPSPSGGGYSESTYSSIAGAWTVVVRGGSPVGGISPGFQGLLVGIGVLVISLLLFALITVLASSRERALALVEEKTKELAHQALHDVLTGLPNRALILDRAEQMLARARRERLFIGALFLDLDNFKAINDGLGHTAGDRLLQELASRLSNVLRPMDTVGRLGGDEFVILVETPDGVDGPERVAKRLLETLREPYLLPDMGGSPLTVTASIGIALDIRDSAEELLRDADVALYVAKASGKNTSRVFRPEMQYAIADRLELEMELWTAVDNGQLFLEYQPIFDLHQGSMTGVEALVRWNHPRRGILSPATFVPIAEDTGLIRPIGRWVLAEACRQAALWRDMGIHMGMSVNISVRQLESDVLVHEVGQVLLDSGLEPQQLTLEITESTLMREPEITMRRLQALKAIGVRLAVDDFGTGYSSLAYLRQFPVDTVKIDRTFVTGIADSPESAALVHTLIQLGMTMGIETLAEGIEEDSHLTFLQQEGCDAGQGYLFSRPVSAAEIERFVGRLPFHRIPGWRPVSAASTVSPDH